MKGINLKLLFVCAFVFLAYAAPVTLADWDEGQPHKMHFPQVPNPQGWDVDFTDIVLADDWKCSETGWVSDIHFWFSVRDDAEFKIEAVRARIFLDDRKTNPDYSQPGKLLWERDFKTDDVVVRRYGQGEQGWYNPGVVPPVVILNDHKDIWQANITRIPDPFLQQQGTIYWLDLQVRATDPTGQVVELGWKTTYDDLHFEDNAVFHQPDETVYYELYDPRTERDMDLAFVITGEPVDLDFGDAPDRPYQTYLARNGARHVVVPGFCLGAPVRVSQESAPGVGDFDNNVLGYVDPYVTPLTTAGYYQYGTPNGASFNGPEPPLTSDRSHLFLVRASDGLSLFVVHDIPNDASGGSSKMHWEIFGDTIALLQGDDPTEGMTISGGGTVIDSSHGWSTCCTDGFAVGSLDGFWTAIGDFNIPPASTSMDEWHVYSSDNSSIPLAFEINRRVRLDYHTSLDPEPDGQPNLTATGDDTLDGNDDEDGVVFTSPLIPGHEATVDVIASADGLLDAWIDWDGNGSWAGNQIFNSVSLTAGRNSLTFTVPPAAIPHAKRFARFRFSSAGGLSYVSLAEDGEVEDYLVKIEPKPPVDHLKWSQPPIRINPSAQGSSSYKLYANTFSGATPCQLLSINPTTGAGSLIGNMTTSAPFGLSDRGTELYTFEKASDGNNVVRLDPTTGNTLNKIHINPAGITGEGGLAFRSDGIGFLASCADENGRLWSLDITVPSSIFIGGFQPSMDGLDFSPGGVLYGIEQGSFSTVDTYELYTIDQATGTPTLVGDTGVPVNVTLAGLTFAPDGTLYAALNNDLYTLDPATGAATLIGPIGFSAISGLTALPTSEAEPALPVYCGWDEPSYSPQPPGAPLMKVVADDYRCIGSMPVTSVHWWGSYLGWDSPYMPELQPESWLITFWSNAVPPDCVVVPNANASVEGTRSNAWPFDLAEAATSSMRYQQIYDAAEVGKSGTITEIRFRPDGYAGTPFEPNDMDVEVFLGYSANPVISPSEVFANNIGSGYVKVFDGTLTLSSAASGGPPHNFDIVVDVDDVFTYDPAMGPLLLDIRMLTNSDTTPIDAEGFGVQIATTRIYSAHDGSVNDPCGTVNYSGPNSDPYGLVTMLCFNGSVPAMAAGKEAASSAIDWETVTIGPAGDVLGMAGANPAAQASASDIQADFVDFSYPETPLWRVRVPSDRVNIEYVGQDEFPLNPDLQPEACFQYYLDLQPDELFWQQDYLERTTDNIFWVSIVAIYDSAVQVGNPWGWKTRPWSWMDDAVTFSLNAEIPIGGKLDPDIVRPIEVQGESYDVSFELDTDPNYIKWEQPFTGMIHWPHYEDVLSMGEVVPPQTLSKYIQPPDLPQGIDVDATDDESTVTTQILADDFPCTTTGPITDIHIWASWFNDEPPNGDPRRVEITLSIHEDIPDPDPGDPDNWSMPGRVLWWDTFYPGEFAVEPLQAYRQGYFMPCTGEYFPDNHYMAYRYDFHLKPEKPFIQEGSPDKEVTYWLDVQAKPLSLTHAARFGWKTSTREYQDVAVFGVGKEPYNGPWKPMNHPETQRRLDMAFEITTTTEPQLQIQSLVADDWKCKEETPVTAAVWWGSYIGYTYKACQDFSIVRPQKPDYFLLNVWTDVPAGDDPIVPYSHPGDIIWEHRAYDYDEVLVGFDKHPEQGPDIVICGGPGDPDWNNDIQAKLLGTGKFNTVSVINVANATPTLAQLQNYDAALVFSNGIEYADSNALGNVMADYVDSGGGVVCMMFEVGISSGGNPAAQMQGRWDNEGYFAIPRTGQEWGPQATLGTVYDPTHPIMQGVSSFDGGTSSYRPNSDSISVGSVRVADWSDGRPLVVTKNIGGVPRADLGFFPPSSDSRVDFWDTSTDGALLMANALTWVAGCTDVREPVFRYSVRLPEDNWFLQEDVNNIYWFSVVAVYEDPATTELYPWGWTNHPHAFNDDAVAGSFDPPAGWFWSELYDQTGSSEDMSFMLFTEPDCINRATSEYNEWSAWGKPKCWCYPRQCRGDGDGIKTGPFWVAIPDLNLFRSAFNQFDTALATIPNGICADFDHIKTGPFRVAIPDLNIFRAYFNRPELAVPVCDQLPIYTGPYNFWTKP